jgi:hypothetical protein
VRRRGDFTRTTCYTPGYTTVPGSKAWGVSNSWGPVCLVLSDGAAVSNVTVRHSRCAALPAGGAALRSMCDPASLLV